MFILILNLTFYKFITLNQRYTEHIFNLIILEMMKIQISIHILNKNINIYLNFLTLKH